MIISPSQLYAALSNTTQEQRQSSKSASAAAGAGAANRLSSQAGTGTTETGSGSAIVSLSSLALAALNNNQSASLESYFPVRKGYSAAALTKAVANPGASSSSSGKNIRDVAKDARSRLDARYKEMTTSGHPFDIKANGKTDAYTLMGEMDRRSLFAVSSNTGGLFSADEQAIAKSIMKRQQTLASGMNPDSSQGQMALANSADSLRAGLSYLGKVSTEEKGSADWKSQVQQLAKLSTVANKVSNYAGTRGMSLFNYF